MKQSGVNYEYYNATSDYQETFLSTRNNQPTSVLKRWQKPGDITSVQKYSTLLRSAIAVGSDVSNSDASYTRLKNCSVSYSINETLLRKLHFKSLRIYIQAQNLITLTNYQGLDPENAKLGGFSLPPLKMITCGLQLSL